MKNDDEALERTETKEISDVVLLSKLGYKNNELLILGCGALLSGALLFMLNLPVNQAFVIIFSTLPISCAFLYVHLFLYNRPPHTFSDTMEGIVSRNQYSPLSKLYNHMPDGMYLPHGIVWDGLQSGVWACGLDLTIPTLNYSKNSSKNHFMRHISAVLHQLSKDDMRVQIYWSVSSNYDRELLQYRQDTEQLPENSPTRKYRTLRYEQFRKLATTRSLRRERVVVFFSRPLRNREKLSWNISSLEYEEKSKVILESLESLAQDTYHKYRAHLSPAGIGCRLLDADDLHYLLKKHFNPSMELMPLLFRTNRREEQSIKEQVLYSDLTPCGSDNCSFLLDHALYNVLVLRSPIPAEVYFGLAHYLTNIAGIQDYEIVVNIRPLDVQKEIKKEETAAGKIQTQLETQKHPAISLRYDYAKHADLIAELKTGKSSPLVAEYYIYIHGLDKEDLMEKTEVIKSAISRMPMDYYTITGKMAAINAFFQGTPGWLFGGRSGYRFRTFDVDLAPLLPLTSTYTGLLDGAEALYEGEQGNLIGVKQFAKRINEDSDPQHTLLFGKTGTGKSVLTADLIMQTHGFYAYTCIIDYGLSYKALAEELGKSPIYLGPSSAVTINYFDTRKMPLTGEHLNFVSSILRVMSDGLATDGMIMRYLQPYYIVSAELWLNRHQEMKEELRSVAYLMDKYLRDRVCDDESSAYLQAVSDWKTYPYDSADLTNFAFEHPHLVLYQCFAYMEAEEFPRHSLFVKYLQSKPLGKNEEDSRALQLATDALALWQHDGKNGRMFDGITNLPMDDDFQYFELSGIPSTDQNFKFVAGALIQMLAMQKIERMDRSLKKRVIIDEANSLFELPQGVKLAENGLTKFRKHRAPMLLSFQQYAMLNQAGVKESITSNIYQYLLMGQTDRNDVKQLSEALGLSGPIEEAVLQFETPANQKGTNRYSSFAQVVKTQGMLSGIGRNRMTPDLLEMIGCVNHIETNNQKRG